jgi:hypothetical protein
MPKRGVYNWTGPVVRELEPGTPYRGFYFDPCGGRRFELGQVVNAGPAPDPFVDRPELRLFQDDFETADGSAWADYGTPTQREGGRLIGGKGMLTVVADLDEVDVAAGAEANSDAEAGIVLRFHSEDNYLVGLYTPLLHALYLHDRRDGDWGDPLGRVAVPEIGPRIRLTAAVSGEYAAVKLTDGERVYRTPLVRVSNVEGGQVGVWLYQIGDRQEYDGFEVTRADFDVPVPTTADPSAAVVWSGEYAAPNVPSPQDWVLVLERAAP